ncbi:hypothetical protein RvY_02647-1 [Ramazzottius varieornatus]|uniref:Uncharacterized protein n=1 Tax=Ramazzottius varieornatus TaxID=947166 RepID=A0A1D1UP81_RAMVA|nr:hypothetical protein RvY_02647-1 [Ramazzottius varieornatus]
MRDVLASGKRKKATGEDLWNMISSLHDRLNGALSGITTLRKDMDNLQMKNDELFESNEVLTKKVLNLEDEFRAHKQNATVDDMESINRPKPMVPSNVNYRFAPNSSSSLSLQRTPGSYASAAASQANPVPSQPNSSVERNTATGDQPQTAGGMKVGPKKRVVRGSIPLLSPMNRIRPKGSYRLCPSSTSRTWTSRCAGYPDETQQSTLRSKRTTSKFKRISNRKASKFVL